MHLQLRSSVQHRTQHHLSASFVSLALARKCKACTAYAAAATVRNVSQRYAIASHRIADNSSARASFGTSSRRLLCATAGPARPVYMQYGLGIRRAAHPQHSNRQGSILSLPTNGCAVLCRSTAHSCRQACRSIRLVRQTDGAKYTKRTAVAANADRTLYSRCIGACYEQ